MEDFVSSFRPVDELADPADKIKMIVQRTILDKRKGIRENLFGQKRQAFVQKLHEDAERAIQQYFEEYKRQNELGFPEITDEELEYLIDRCYENLIDYEARYEEEKNREIAEFIIREEAMMNEYYQELENSLTVDQAQNYFQNPN